MTTAREPACPLVPAPLVSSQAASARRLPVAPLEGEPPADGTTVRVTIGRIEVRAPAPPRPATGPRAAAAHPALLSLDDYLKQREGRGS